MTIEPIELQSLKNDIKAIYTSNQYINLDNPSDYNNDKKVLFTYQSKDRMGVVAKNETIFWGQSIYLSKYYKKFF